MPRTAHGDKYTVSVIRTEEDRGIRLTKNKERVIVTQKQKDLGYSYLV